MKNYQCWALWHRLHERPLMGANPSANAKQLLIFPSPEDAQKIADTVERETSIRLLVMPCVLTPVPATEAVKP